LVLAAVVANASGSSCIFKPPIATGCFTPEEESELFVASRDVIALGTVLDVRAEEGDPYPTSPGRFPRIWRRVKFLVETGLKGVTNEQTIVFFAEGGQVGSHSMVVSVPSPEFERGEKCLVLLTKARDTDVLIVGSQGKLENERIHECLGPMEQAIRRDGAAELAARSSEIVHGTVVSREFPVDVDMVPRVYKDCRAASEVVGISVSQTLKGSDHDTLTVVIPKIIYHAYPQFAVGEDIVVFLQPLENNYWKLAGYKGAKVLVKDGKITRTGEALDEFLSNLFREAQSPHAGH
jgi:hypothetical protein